MAAAGHIEIWHMCSQLYVWRKIPECPRKADKGRHTHVFSLYAVFGAQLRFIQLCAPRGIILLLLIINWRLTFRLMVAGFVAEGSKHAFCLVTRRVGQMRSMGIKTRGSGCCYSDTGQNAQFSRCRCIMVINTLLPVFFKTGMCAHSSIYCRRWAPARLTFPFAAALK